MKKHYFKRVQIDQKMVKEFLQLHPTLGGYVDVNQPFFARVSKKPYPGLIHTIISQDQESSLIIEQWNHLIKVAKKIKPNKINEVDLQTLTTIVGEDKAKLIKQINADILNHTLDLDKLVHEDDLTIVNTLSRYPNLSLSSIQIFLIFTCWKQDVLCNEDIDFVKGLKIFLNKQNIEADDINKIKIEYVGQLTLFSLCMWKIRNERSGN